MKAKIAYSKKWERLEAKLSLVLLGEEDRGGQGLPTQTLAGTFSFLSEAF
jgi:hypothetical protein